jgi:predicted DNA-binding transcriptional regulator YafY
MWDKRRPHVRERLIRLDELLRNGRPNSLESLATALGKTPRTICRDLQFLKTTVGLPIRHDPAGGYHLEAQAPPLEEASAPATAVEPPPPAGRRKAREELLRTIHQALCEGRGLILRLETRPEAGGEEWRVNPHFLSKVDGEFVLFARRPADGALVNLPLRRVRGASLDQEAGPDADMADVRIKRRECWVPSGTMHRVILRFPGGAEWVRDLRIADGQTMETAGAGDTVIRFATDDLEAVRRLARLLGDAVWVEGPEPLKSSVPSQRTRVRRGRRTP